VSEPFSVKAAIRYLEALNGETLDFALNYIRRAPPEVQTPVRPVWNILENAVDPAFSQRQPRLGATCFRITSMTWAL
jgi:hypothetical protein